MGALLLAVLVVGACAAGPTVAPSLPAAFVDGVVTRVEGKSPTDVTAFTLHTEDGRLVDFSVGRLDLSGKAFPAGHLRDHLATAQPVRVIYLAGGDTPVAIRLEDAPP